MNTTLDDYNSPEKNLVAQILKQAMDDLWLHPKSSDSSLGFFMSRELHYGSYLWCCEILDVTPAYINKQIYSRVQECLRILERVSKTPKRKRIRTDKLLELLTKTT